MHINIQVMQVPLLREKEVDKSKKCARQNVNELICLTLKFAENS